jgi:hypothetical protein
MQSIVTNSTVNGVVSIVFTVVVIVILVESARGCGTA